MNAPAPPAVAPVAAGSGATPTAPAAEAVTDDFVLMLGQLLGAPVVQSVTSTKAPANAATDLDSEADQAAQDAAAVTGLPLTLMTSLTPNASADGAAVTGKSLELLPVVTGAAGSQPEVSSKTAELATAVLDNLSGDDSHAMPTGYPGSQPAQALDLSRPVVTPDPASMRTVHQPVGSSAWADELGTRMIMMSERGQHSASLRLSPEHLGPLEVRISVRDDQASVWFGASHADTRAAIEQALPRLRELFASQGMSLADAGVHHQSPREHSRTSPSVPQGALSASAEVEASASPAAIRLGLVDAYA